MGARLPADEYLEPFLFGEASHALSDLQAVLVLGTGMVQECSRLPEAQVLDALAPEVLLIDEADGITDIVQGLRTLNDLIKQITFLEQNIAGFLPPEVEKVVLE